MTNEVPAPSGPAAKESDTPAPGIANGVAGTVAAAVQVTPPSRLYWKVAAAPGSPDAAIFTWAA